MDISQITVWLAFLAGLASFLSPCVFSLVPAYVGYLGGRAAGAGDSPAAG
jgi:cytochrome c-type biogenesis protein